MIKLSFFQERGYGQMTDPTFQNGMNNNSNGMAVASLVLGIIAVCCCCVPALSLVLGILAIVFSVLSRKNPAKSGLGTAGLVLGIIASVLAIVSIIVAQTDWYQTTVTQQLIDTFGDQYADMLN